MCTKLYTAVIEDSASRVSYVMFNYHKFYINITISTARRRSIIQNKIALRLNLKIFKLFRLLRSKRDILYIYIFP